MSSITWTKPTQWPHKASRYSLVSLKGHVEIGPHVPLKKEFRSPSRAGRVDSLPSTTIVYRKLNILSNTHTRKATSTHNTANNQNDITPMQHALPLSHVYISPHFPPFHPFSPLLPTFTHIYPLFPTFTQTFTQICHTTTPCPNHDILIKISRLTTFECWAGPTLSKLNGTQL